MPITLTPSSTTRPLERATPSAPVVAPAPVVTEVVTDATPAPLDAFSRERATTETVAPRTNGGFASLAARRTLSLRAASMGDTPLSRLMASGVAVTSPTVDYAREGTFTVPGAPSFAVEPSAITGGQRERLVDTLRGPLALHPSSGPAFAHEGVRIFVPGLNTPEPEASRRTALYVDALGLSMAHLHNGTGSSLGDLKPIPGLGDVVLPADKRDWAEALAVRQGLMESRLKGPLADVVVDALLRTPPVPVSIALYSDSTIGGVQGLALAKERLVEARLPVGASSTERARVTDEVEALMGEHLFVELHGNGCPSLPNGPRYLVWTDVGDPLTTKELPVGGTVGVYGKSPDRDATNVVYVDYQGPYSDRGFNAHNLGASGIHTVRAILAENGVTTPEALFDKAARGERIAMPDPASVVGVERELW